VQVDRLFSSDLSRALVPACGRDHQRKQQFQAVAAPEQVTLDARAMRCREPFKGDALDFVGSGALSVR
jgi:hypothetical protein